LEAALKEIRSPATAPFCTGALVENCIQPITEPLLKEAYNGQMPDFEWCRLVFSKIRVLFRQPVTTPTKLLQHHQRLLFQNHCRRAAGSASRSRNHQRIFSSERRFWVVLLNTCRSATRTAVQAVPAVTFQNLISAKQIHWKVTISGGNVPRLMYWCGCYPRRTTPEMAG